MTKFSYSAPGKPKEPVSRFPADAEGAIVMTRPNKEHEDKFNAKRFVRSCFGFPGIDTNLLSLAVVLLSSTLLSIPSFRVD